ncbi:hypothetical protein [Lacinutrix chionoecetis]
MTKDKKHADFQSKYRKSSNFDKVTKDEKFQTDGKGNLKKKSDLNELSAEQKDKIAKSMDNMHHDIEMIPGAPSNEEE